jgi:putative FmdB family regulatory protein
MLIHDYKCADCDHIQEEIHPFYEKPKIRCKLCNGHSHKLIGSVGFLRRQDLNVVSGQRSKAA